jgi:hypothetical protein
LVAATLPVPWNEYLASILIGTEDPIIPLMVNGDPVIPHISSEVVLPEAEYDLVFGFQTPLVTFPGVCSAVMVGTMVKVTPPIAGPAVWNGTITLKMICVFVNTTPLLQVSVPTPLPVMPSLALANADFGIGAPTIDMAVTIAIIVRAIVDAFISTGFKSNYLLACVSTFVLFGWTQLKSADASFVDCAYYSRSGV